MVDHLGHIVEATTREYSSAPSTPCASAWSARCWPSTASSCGPTR